ncbi:unnamed protein product [Sympodiomycopsis kandeliae]
MRTPLDDTRDLLKTLHSFGYTYSRSYQDRNKRSNLILSICARQSMSCRLRWGLIECPSRSECEQKKQGS